MILTGREVVYVIGDYPATPFGGNYPCGQTEATTTADIAALGGGGGISPGPVTNIISGTSFTTTPLTDIFLAWRSPVLAPKATVLTATGMISGQVITIKDCEKNFYNYPCTVSAAELGVTIDGEDTFVMDTSGMGASFKWDSDNSDFLVF